LLYVGVVISHATIDKSRVDERKVEHMKKEIEFLRNQVNYYKESWETITNFIDNVLEESEKHEQVKRNFLEKIVEL
jgi:hypothetical protein